MKNILAMFILMCTGICFAAESALIQQLALLACVLKEKPAAGVVEGQPVYQNKKNIVREQKKQKHPKNRNAKITQPRRGY